jgi:hypothetical protein
MPSNFSLDFFQALACFYDTVGFAFVNLGSNDNWERSFFFPAFFFFSNCVVVGVIFILEVTSIFSRIRSGVKRMGINGDAVALYDGGGGGGSGRWRSRSISQLQFN